MNQDQPLMSVVIPSLNVASTLGAQLDALGGQSTDFEWELLVVDNGSSDDTVSVARKHGGQLRLIIVREATRGRQFACNAGARAASGELLVFVDGDDVVQPGFLQAMAEGLQSFDLVAGRLENQNLVEDGGLQFGSPTSDAIIKADGFLSYASGACTGIRKEVFNNVGGFGADANYCEDADLSWRVQLAGYRLGSAPEAVVSYRQRSTFAAMFRQHRNYGKARVWLYRTFRDDGMPRRSLRTTARDWMLIVRAVPHLRDIDVRTRWTRRLGRNIGLVIGSVSHRCLYL